MRAAAELRDAPLAPPADPVEAARQAFLGRAYFPALDGVRALAIAMVVWHHAAAARFPGTLLARGNHGVDLFFALSGFLITTLLLRERRANGRIDLARFWVRRALRIFPLYYATIAVYCALVAMVERGSPAGQQFWRNLPAFATYTSNWFVELEGARVIFYFAWSLATEEQFYLVWPWIVVAGRGGPLAASAMALLLVASRAVAWGAGAHLVAPDALWVRVAASVAPAIGAGALAAWIVEQPRGFRLVHAVAGRRGSVALAAIAVAGAIALGAPVAIAIAATWLVVSLCLADAPPVRALFASRAARHVGTVSYGMYMTHMFAVNVARKLAHEHDGVAVFAIGLPLSVAFGTASYHGFERWFLRLKDRLGRPRAAGAS